ncbi:hypothetical protein [Halosegnis longus]|uniref:hypothetical protein n=1 Tax=Halosegnis longus TaxID=2216012 RepID=UPI00129EF9D5|nr:hypothetical protein [Halosegnis longus]
MSVDVPSQSRKSVEGAAAETPNDYHLGAKVGENSATTSTRDFVSTDDDVAVAVVTIEESRISIAGRGYEEVPDDFFESATATQ